MPHKVNVKCPELYLTPLPLCTVCRCWMNSVLSWTKTEMRLNIRLLLRLVCQRFFGEHTSKRHNNYTILQLNIQAGAVPLTSHTFILKF